jgi:hypothetical protein
MKQKHMLSLLQTGYTTVNVYFADHNGVEAAVPKARGAAPAPWAEDTRVWNPNMQAQTPTPRTYTYKTKDRDLKPGDRVIVESQNSHTGLTIAVVHRLDETPRIDVDADFDYKWIVQRVDMAPYNAILEAEAKFNDTLQEVERTHQREILLSKMTEHLPPNSQARTLFDAAVASFSAAFGAQPAIAAPVAPAPQPEPVRPYVDAQAAGVCEQAIPGIACK